MLLSHRLYNLLPDRVRWQLAPRVRYETFGLSVILPRPQGNGLQPRALAAWKRHALATLLPLTDGSFIDVGANLGQTLIEFRSTGIRRSYIGCEPNAQCVAYLESLIAANHYEDCSIVPIGLGAGAQLCALYLNSGPGDNTDAAATLLADLRPKRRTIASWVSVHSFDAIRSALSIARVGLVKIDVEGAESDTVAGMVNTLAADRPLVLCEVLGADPAADLDSWTRRATKLATSLESVRYLIFRLVKSGDLRRVVALTAMADFPVEVWTPERAECFDYLFVPEERADEVLSAIDSGQ